MTISQRPSDFVEMRRAGDALSELGYLVVHLLAVSTGPMSAEGLRLTDDLDDACGNNSNVSWILFSTKLASTLRVQYAVKHQHPEREKKWKWLEWPVRTAVRWRLSKLKILFYPAFWLVHFFVIARAHLRTMRGLRDAMVESGVEVLLLPEDVVGLVTPQAVRAARDLDIPSIILPYTIANQEEAFRSLAQNPQYQRRLLGNFVVSLFHARWVMSRGGTSLVRLPAPYIVGHVLTGTSPPDPWMMNSGFASCIAVESEVMAQYYRDGGIEDGRMQIVGALYDDVLARYRMHRSDERTVLRRELGLQGERPIILIGGCPNQLLGPVPGFDFKDLNELVDFLAQCLKSAHADCHVIVRPHPNYPELGQMFETYGFVSTMVDTARLVALSDLYLAFASATIRWAIACGIPSINYDVFHYDYDDYKEVPGVWNAAAPDEVSQAIRSLLPGSASYEEARMRAEGEMTRWGTLDGQSARRITGLIEMLCAKSGNGAK